MQTTIRQSSKYFSSSVTGLPSQTVSQSEKESREWQVACMDFFDYISSVQHAEKVEDLKKYKILGPDYTFGSYTNSLNPFTSDQELKDEYGSVPDIKHFPIIASPINTIVGEYVKRPLNFYCVNTSPRARNEYYRVKSEQLFQYALQKVQSRVIASLQKEGITPESEDFQEQVQTKMPDEIQNWMNKDYCDIGEQIAQKLLNNLRKSQMLDLEFLEGFKHAVVTAKEFYHIYAVSGNTKVKCISPLDVFYQKSPNVRWVSDAQYAGFRLYLTPSSVIDNFREKLSVSDIEDIESIIKPGSKSYENRNGNIYYNTHIFATNQGATFNALNEDEMSRLLDMYEHTGTDGGYYMNNLGLIKVVQAYWKSYYKLGVLTYYEVDENGVEQEREMYVDENYEPDTASGQYVVYGPAQQVYQGVRIGDDITIDVRPYEHQFFDEDDLDYNPLPIEGCCFNDLHMKPTSLVDLMRVWNELYNLVAYELRKDMRKAIGKVMFMSYDNMPKVAGFTKEKWLYWVREFGIAWVSNDKRSGQFSHYSSQDMSFAEQMLAKMQILDKIKMNCDAFAGFSQPRLGDATQIDTARQSQQSIVASVNQTEYWYYKHSRLVEKVLTHALNLMKRQISNKQYLRNLLDDMELAYIEMENIDIANEKLHVFVTNSDEALAQREALRSLLQPAVQNGADLVDMSDILLAETQSEVRNVLERLRQERRQQAAEARQLEQQKLQQEATLAENEQEWEREKHYSELQSQERQAYMRSFAFQDNNLQDPNNNSIPDILEFNDRLIASQAQSGKLILDQMKAASDLKRVDNDARLKNRELDLKEKELKIEKDNQKNDLQIARENSRNRRGSN